MKRIASFATLFLIAGCAISSGPGTTKPGTREVSRYAVIHEGPELAVALGFHHATRSIGDEWLILAVELTAADGSGRAVVKHSDISAITPDGRRLALVSQEEFRENFAEIRVALERSLRSLPILGRYDRSQMPCDRWFLVGPFGGFAYDEVPVNTFQLCSGPMVFKVIGGIQPGRWRLIIEQEESRVDVPFELEAETIHNLTQHSDANRAEAHLYHSNGNFLPPLPYETQCACDEGQ